ncbi:hypothetical protein, partial [Salinimicrobium oceani]
MKKFNFFATIVAGLLFIFSSCSKDEIIKDNPDPDKAVLSFGAVLNDLSGNNSTTKQSFDLPDCADGEPAYVEVVLSGTTAVGSMDAPLIVDLNPTPADFDDDGEEEFFTVESPDLELEPGPYNLEFFA